MKITKSISADYPLTNSTSSNQSTSAASNQEALPEINDSNVHILRRLIHQQLDEIRTGNAYVEHELNSDCFSKLLTDDDTFSKFETMTGKKWMNVDIMDETSLNGGKLNKKRKQYITAIKLESHFVKREIENYTKLSQNGDEDSQRRRRKANAGAEEDTVSSLSESKVSSSSHKRKKKHKKSKKKKQREKQKEKKKAKKSKKRKRDHQHEEFDEDDDEDDLSGDSSSSDVDTAMNDVDLKAAAPLSESANAEKHRGKKSNDKLMEERRKQFEQERDEIINNIPKEVKNQFKECGFAKWNKDWLPIMFLGPFDVAPGPVRDQWMAMVEKTKKNRTDLSRLVFWYGTQEDDMANAFSFVQTKTTLSYKEAVAKGCDKLSAKIQKKIDQGKKLSSGEALTKRGFELIRKDIKLPKEKRQPWLFDFEEEYELSDDEDEIEEEIMEESPKKKKAKMKKTKDIDDEDVYAKEKIIDEPKTKKTGKRKHQPDDGDMAEGSTKKKKKKLSRKSQQKSKQLDNEIEKEVEQEDKFLREDDAPSEDDKNDDDFSVDSEGSGIDDDEDDELYVEKGKKPKTKKLKKVTRTNAKDEESMSKSSTKSKSKVKPKNLSNKKLMKLEQQMFEECEGIFIPLMEKLKKEDLSLKSVEKQLRTLLRELDVITPAFIKEYQIGLFVKQVRTKYKENGVLNQLCKSITQKMKALYKEKLESQPVDFIAKRTFKFPEKKENQIIPTSSMHKNEDESEEKEVAVKGHTIPKKHNITPSETKPSKESFEKAKVDLEPKSSTTKPFKLMNIMNQQNRASPNPQDSSNIVKKKPQKEIVHTSKSDEKKLPSWMSAYPTCEQKIEGDIDRWLSIKFLHQAVRFFPAQKDLDYESVACALEDAIYKHLGKNCEEYWDRVHDICGALVGKEIDGHKHQDKMGLLARKIIAGDFESPLDVIKTPKKMLLQSYEGTLDLLI